MQLDIFFMNAILFNFAPFRHFILNWNKIDWQQQKQNCIKKKFISNTTEQKKKCYFLLDQSNFHIGPVANGRFLATASSIYRKCWSGHISRSTVIDCHCFWGRYLNWRSFCSRWCWSCCCYCCCWYWRCRRHIGQCFIINRYSTWHWRDRWWFILVDFFWNSIATVMISVGNLRHICFTVIRLLRIAIQILIVFTSAIDNGIIGDRLRYSSMAINGSTFINGKQNKKKRRRKYTQSIDGHRSLDIIFFFGSSRNTKKGKLNTRNDAEEPKWRWPWWRRLCSCVILSFVSPTKIIFLFRMIQCRRKMKW